MQPYIFPYLGYFQLIHATDTFVFYDDVNFIKRGWINRNRILVNGGNQLFTVPLKKASQNRLINEIELAIDAVWLKQFYKTIEHNYKKAPYFEQTYELIKSIFQEPHKNISELAIHSVITICDYLEMNKNFVISSEKYHETKGQEKSERLINITKACNGTEYINPKGGKALYDKTVFESAGLALKFLESKPVEYLQFKNKFVPNLSIIDVLMFNSPEEINVMLKQYELV